MMRATAAAAGVAQESLAHALTLVPHAPALAHLELHSATRFTPEAATFRACLPAFAGLTALRLSGAALGDGRLLHAIGAAPGHALSRLEALKLARCGIGNNDAAQLGAMLQHMPRLRSLAIPESEVGALGLQWLLGHWSRVPVAMAAISYLDLSSNALGPEGALAVALPVEQPCRCSCS